MMVRIDFYQGSSASPEWKNIGFALSVVAARLNNMPFKLPNIDISKEQHQVKANAHLQLAVENQEWRKLMKSNSPFKTTPTNEESAMLHELFMLSRKDPANYQNLSPMNETKLESTQIMHSQQKNIHGKIFGGFLMKQALDLAYITARIYSNTYNPILLVCDKMNFFFPVEVGSMLRLTSIIPYTYKDILRVHVAAESLLSNNKSTQTNEFHFTFKSEKPVKQVLPQTYRDGMLFLENKRRIEYLVSK